MLGFWDLWPHFQIDSLSRGTMVTYHVTICSTTWTSRNLSFFSLDYPTRHLEYHEKKDGRWRRGGTRICGQLNHLWGTVFFSFGEFSVHWHVSLASHSFCALGLPWTAPFMQSYSSITSNKELLHPVTIPNKTNACIPTIAQGISHRLFVTAMLTIVAVPAQPRPAWPFHVLFPNGPHFKH